MNRKEEKTKRKINIKNKKGITLIALVITIIVLLILAGVSIAMLTGQNGILTQASNAKTEQSHGAVREAIALLYNEYQIQKRTGSVTKLASTESVKIEGKEERALANTTVTFLDFLKGENEAGINYIKDEINNILDVEKLTGGKQALGNGTGTDDVYKIEDYGTSYKIIYYEKAATSLEISVITKEEGEQDPFSYTQADIDETLKYFTWKMVDVTEENREEYGYDESMVGKKVAIITGTKENYYISMKGGTFPLKKIVIPRTIEGSDYVDINTDWTNNSLEYLGNLETVIYLNDLGTFSLVGCRDLINVKLTRNNEISRSSFHYTNLETIDIPNEVKIIDSYAFAECQNLTTINIPNSVTSIGYDAFANCPNLTITVEAGSPLTKANFENTGIDLNKVIFEDEEKNEG